MAKLRSEKDVWGNTEGTGANSVNRVILAATHPLTENEIRDEIERKGYKLRGAIRRHLEDMAKDWGYVKKTDSGWVRTDHGSDVAGVPRLGFQR